MFKILKILLLAVILTLSFYSSSASVEKFTIDSIVSYANSIEQGKYNNFEVYKMIDILRDGTKVEITLFWSKENTADHDYFDWSWTIHMLKINRYLAYNITELETIPKDYQDFVSIRSRGFTQWILADIDLDGKVDFGSRDFSIVSCNDEEEGCTNNHIIMPSYPEGFIDVDWYTPSEKESQKRYDNEIGYWTKTIWGQEDD